MLRNTGEDFPASPETEQLLSGRAHAGTPDVHVRLRPGERLCSDNTCPQSGVSPSGRTTPRVTPPAALNADGVPQMGETSSDPNDVVITSPAVIVDDDRDCNDDPPPYSTILPPYSVIALPNHVSWDYGVFSLDHSYATDGRTAGRAEIPLAIFQGAPTAPTGFRPEAANGGDQFATPLTPYQCSKFGCRSNSIVPRQLSFSNNGIVEKIDDTKSRKYGAILVAAAIIIFLMALSLMVRFVVERNWWRT